VRDSANSSAIRSRSLDDTRSIPRLPEPEPTAHDAMTT
jgi:hypothetical protein